MLKARNLTVTFGATTVLDRVDIDVADHQTVAVLGPSGSGKSTLLRVIAGLQAADRGATVLVAQRDVTHSPPHRRGLGLMFQDHALFPHLSVAQNVAFGLKAHGVSRVARKQKVADLLELVGLAALGPRAIHTLSGGQQQRTALARALAPEPQLLMLDEPFGQLDRSLAERLVAELRELFTDLGMSVLAVTHNHQDAFALADQVVIMNAGRIAQRGTPADVWGQPASAFVARFLGFLNVVTASVNSGLASTPWGTIPVSGDAGTTELLIRPHGIRVDPAGPLLATITAHLFRGDHTVLRLAPAHGPPLEAALAPGETPPESATVRVRIDPAHVVFLKPPGSIRADDG